MGININMPAMLVENKQTRLETEARLYLAKKKMDLKVLAIFLVGLIGLAIARDPWRISGMFC